ncbi:OLC1v1009098C1 [Oldenlandia corymbosa var. corymbosa]|uniref:Glutathione hydrolase n=1 Tax=Oldenlandia corymbosa var. corymbosa TaxID=529605 RepID=A0AAV1DN88_OLDCO|nr:OLC1v1009098C1 [Oldenlandia corymbosa var. corymbosa]
MIASSTAPQCLLLAILFLFLLVPSSLSSSVKTEPAYKRKERITAQHGAVVADDGRCSRVGNKVLREGGHAVDATVAAALCLGVVSPASSGIGGGAFMIVRSADGKSQAFDFRETAPKKAFRDMYSGNGTLKAAGPLSVAVPGELLGLYLAWKQYGRLPWSRLVKPAARFAIHGFRISPYLRMQMVATESGIMADKGLRDIFTANGTLLKAGDTCHNVKLGEVLMGISKSEMTPFYNGSVGYNLVKDVSEAGGILTMDDLQQYQVKIREPITTTVMGVDIIGMPPPSSGGPAMALILNILAQYGAALNSSRPLMMHREIEALKHAFAVRMNLGDPDFVDIKAVLNDMLSIKFAKELQKTIYDTMTFSPPYYGGRWNQINDHGTSHLSIIDKDRNAVSITSTINGYFGAKFLSPSTGIILNNEMDDFSMPENTSANEPPPSPENFIHAGKRPLSSMSPTIVVQGGNLKAVVGASGGSRIIAATAEVFLNHFVNGMDPLASVMSPRVYHELIPNVVHYEDWKVVTGDHIEVPEEIRSFLKKRGHVLEGLAGGTICQFVVQDLKSGKLVAVSDPRKGGFPAGY